MKQQDIFYDIDNVSVENEDDVKVNLNEYQQSVIWSTDWTTGTIVNQMDKGTIDLKPKFQRREAWDDKRKSKFIESIILGLPIPQIILAERKDKKGTYIVIDGKQRLLSIRQFFSKADDVNFPRLRLKGLDSLDNLNNCSFIDLQADPSLEDFAMLVENQPIRTIVIKNWPNEAFLYNVFLRLNTGSLPLAPQELRQALHPGLFIDFTDQFSIDSNQIKRVLNIEEPDYRMRDIELVIRFYSFKYFINTYNGNLKRFFDTTVEQLNEAFTAREVEIRASSAELNHAIDFTYNIWGENAFRKWKDGNYQGKFNRAIYDIMVYYFSDPNFRQIAINHFVLIEERFRTLCATNNEFLNSFETSTKNITPTNTRYSVWGNALNEICGTQVEIPNLLA
jgi:hypothetical protein